MRVILLIPAHFADSVSARRANIWRLRALCGGSEHGLVHSHIDPLGFAALDSAGPRLHSRAPEKQARRARRGAHHLLPLLGLVRRESHRDVLFGV